MIRQRQIRLLITSVGSLVGQNLLDAIGFAGFDRRDRFFIAGTNSDAASPNNFRCDVCHLVPLTSSAEFSARLECIVEQIAPDLILAGRDEDTIVLRRLKDARPDLDFCLPHGAAQTLEFALDKWQTWQFSQRHALPFAATFLPGPSGDHDALRAFCDRHGYPLIAKPRRGYASQGVFFVRSRENARDLAARPDYLFQEYLGSAQQLQPYFDRIDGPTPLFAHAPAISHYSCHTVIGPDRSVAPVFVSRNEHDAGRTVAFRRVDEPELASIGVAYAEAIAAEGGCGPVTVQFRRSGDGRWKAQEMNMRTNGNTFARLLLGQDELHDIVSRFIPRFDLPPFRPPAGAETRQIAKILTTFAIDPMAVERLRLDGVWRGAGEADAALRDPSP